MSVLFAACDAFCAKYIQRLIRQVEGRGPTFKGDSRCH